MSLRHTIKLPRLGDTTEQVVVLEWMVAVGDSVEAGQTLLLAETDKAQVEVPAPIAGIVEELLVEPDAEIETGARICVISG